MHVTTTNLKPSPTILQRQAPIVAALAVCGLAAWIAVSADPVREAPHRASAPPAAAAAPYESPYPAPRVDPNAPPQEPAPTF
jgi:hypothetical protein